MKKENLKIMSIRVSPSVIQKLKNAGLDIPKMIRRYLASAVEKLKKVDTDNP